MISDHPHEWEMIDEVTQSSNGLNITIRFRCVAEAECKAVLSQIYIFASEEIEIEEG